MKRSVTLLQPHLRAIVLATLGILIALTGSMSAADFLGPEDMVATADGKMLLIAARDAKQLLVFDIATNKVTKTIDVPGPATGVALSPDGAKAYVTCGLPKGVVAVIDVAAGNVAGTIPAGHTPVGPSVSPDGKRLYVCNRFDNNVSVIDLAQGKEVAPVPRDAGTVSRRRSRPDGKTLVVINHLPLDPSDGYDVAANVAADRRRPPSGRRTAPAQRQFELAGRLRVPRRQVRLRHAHPGPLPDADHATGARLDEHQRLDHHRPGGQEARLNTVLLDDVDLGAANPWGVTAAAGRQVRSAVTHAGTHEVSVIDAAGMIDKLAEDAGRPQPTNDR